MATKAQLRALKKARAAKKRKYKKRVRRKAGRGVKVVYRRKAGRRKTNRKFGRKRGIKTGRRGTVAYRVGKRTVATNPRKRRKGRRRTRRNPVSLQGYTRGFTSAPGQIMKTFQGKNAIKNSLYLAGGTVAAYLAGGFTSKLVSPVLNMIPGAAGLLQKPMVQRVVGASMNYTAGYLISGFVKDKQLKTAIRLGGALAAIVEVVSPGMLGQWVSKIPGVGMTAATAEAATGPTEGLANYYGTELAGFVGEYVDASAYQGAGEYVDASAYQGAGEYVDASAYQGAGDDGDALAGSFLDEADMFQSYI